MLKKIVSLILALSVLLFAFALAEEEESGGEFQLIELGTTGLTVEIPASYYKGEITTEDTDESQVAYYRSDENLVDFDIYQWAKAAGETLQSVAEEEAAEFGSELIETAINDIPVFYYEAVEEYDGAEYPTLTCLTENGDFFAEIVFWADGEEDAPWDTIEGIIDTLYADGSAEVTAEGNEIVLGTSSLKISLPFNYVKGEITAADTDENQVAYYYSEESLVDFDVYQWAKAEGETLQSAAEEEAAEFGAEAGYTDLGGVDLAYYTAVEESEGVDYATTTFIAEDGDDFVEIVFWMDGEDAPEVVDMIIGSITR